MAMLGGQVDSDTSRLSLRSNFIHAGNRTAHEPRQSAMQHPRVCHHAVAQYADVYLFPQATILVIPLHPYKLIALLQVLDVGQVVAGNFAGALLAYFGATVYKVS